MPKSPSLRVAAVPVALLVVGLGTLPLFSRFAEVTWVTALLVAVAAGATALRRARPGPALIVAAAATSAYLIAGFPYGPILLSFGVTVYSAGRRLTLRRALPWAVAALAIVLIHTFTGPPGLVGLAPGSAWVIVPFTLGAARRLVVEAQGRERAETERRIADAERLRLSQEVHDVVGHGLAAIQMQADIALHLRDSRPALAHEALTAISAAAFEALEELRATLAGVPPSPGLSGAADLCDRLRAAGVSVTLTVHGPATTLPAATDAAAYRILQESLTNVLKHAAQRQATVTIHHHPTAVDLRITNPAPPLPHTDGFGITGMRRRAAHLGGTLTATLTATPTPPTTFTVHAVLPHPTTHPPGPPPQATPTPTPPPAAASPPATPPPPATAPPSATAPPPATPPLRATAPPFAAAPPAATAPPPATPPLRATAPPSAAAPPAATAPPPAAPPTPASAPPPATPPAPASAPPPATPSPSASAPHPAPLSAPSAVSASVVASSLRREVP
ncbi:sensor histidine kinase [Actinoplanes sp. CA-054009]